MKYIKDTRTEDEKMLDIIHRNHDTIRMNKLIDQELNKKESKSNFKFYLIIGFILITIIGVIWNYSNKQVDTCVEAGHDRNWCIING